MCISLCEIELFVFLGHFHFSSVFSVHVHQPQTFKMIFIHIKIKVLDIFKSLFLVRPFQLHLPHSTGLRPCRNGVSFLREINLIIMVTTDWCTEHFFRSTPTAVPQLWDYRQRH